MPKRLSSIDRQRLSLANILQRLPLHRQFSDSQSSLLKLSPVWQAWANAHLAKESIREVQLSNYQSGVLSLACNNATCASQLKHLQTSLLAFLKRSGFNEAKKISIRMIHPTHVLPSSPASRRAIPTGALVNDQAAHTKASPPSIKSIEECKKTISNERLAESLTKLAETLKKQN